jgi:hypothetical protein
VRYGTSHYNNAEAATFSENSESKKKRNSAIRGKANLSHQPVNYEVHAPLAHSKNVNTLQPSEGK